MDETRVYLTGVSMGGMGCWEVAAARADLFTAIAPIAAYHKDDMTEFLADKLRLMPIHCVTSTADETCPTEKEEVLHRRLRDNGSQSLDVSRLDNFDHSKMQETRSARVVSNDIFFERHSF